MKQRLDDAALDQLFRNARTYPTWQDKPVTVEQVLALYDLLKMGPTSMNCMPGRFVFIASKEGKERLVPALMPGNVEKVRQAPLTVIVAHDIRFYEHMSRLWPHAPEMRDMFAGNPDLAGQTAFRNATLQGGYLIMAARALGLDVGPMSGFDNGKVDEEFFPDGRFHSNFLANIGYGDDSGVHPRGPRPSFELAAMLL